MACPLGTGVLIQQEGQDSTEFTAHLTLLESRELASALVVAIHNAKQGQVGPKSVTSLYVKGLRIDQIAHELDKSIQEVREELINRGLIKDQM